jgi:hypothetical protein
MLFGASSDATQNSIIQIANCYSTGTINNTTINGGICGGYVNLGKGIDYANKVTTNITNCYTLYGENINASTQNSNVIFNISYCYSANGIWSSENALKQLITDVTDAGGSWVYQKVNGIDQTNSPFLLFLLNSTNTLVGSTPVSALEITEIQPNKITGTAQPNSTIVVTETTANNQILTSQTQSNAQGIWDFNVTTPSNNYSFAPLNANQFSKSIQSNYNWRYLQSKYTLTKNTQVSIKPRQHGINQLDQRSWRISSKLPAGLKFSSTTGIISGTPSAPAPSTTYNIWSNSEVFLSYRRQLTIEIVSP